MVGPNASHLWVNKRLLTRTNIPVFFYNQNEICGYGPVVSGGTMHLTNACQVLESIKQNWGEVPRQFWQATAISTRPIIHTTSLHSATALAFYHFLTLFLSLSLSLSHTHSICLSDSLPHSPLCDEESIHLRVYEDPVSALFEPGQQAVQHEELPRVADQTQLVGNGDLGPAIEGPARTQVV